MSVASVDDRGEERIKREKSDGVDTDVEMEDVEKVEAEGPPRKCVFEVSARISLRGPGFRSGGGWGGAPTPCRLLAIRRHRCISRSSGPAPKLSGTRRAQRASPPSSGT